MKRVAEANKHRERRILSSRHRNGHVSELAHICHSIEKLVITMEKNLIDIRKIFNLERIKVTFSILQHLNFLFTEHCLEYAINNLKPGEVECQRMTENVSTCNYACADILCTARDAVIIAKLGVYLFKNHKKYMLAAETVNKY